MADKIHIEEIEAQAALFALGALSPEDAANFRKRLSAGCPLCQVELQECQEAAAALALTVPEVPPPPRLKARLMASIAEEGSAPEAGVGTIVRPGDTSWESLNEGVKLRWLLGRKTMLVRMQPGAVLPAHDHKYAEQCLVLEGSITNGTETARAGDFTFMPSGSRHSTLQSPEGCLLLIAYT